MPIKRAAYKQIRADKKKRAKNVATISAIRTAAKKLDKLLSSKNKDQIKESLKNFVSIIYKAAKRGIIKKGTASRKVARMSKRAHKALK